MAELDFSELSKFESDLIQTAQKFKKGKHAKSFLRKKGTELNRENKKQAKASGIKQRRSSDKAFYKRFKKGKIYTYDGSLCIRGYNSAPHAHLLNNGHRIVGPDGSEKGFVKGARFLEKAKKNFEGKFEQDIEDFIDQMLNEHGMW